MAKNIKFKICGPHQVGFYTIGEAKLSEHCGTSLPLLFTFSRFFLLTALWGQGAGEVW